MSTPFDDVRLNANGFAYRDLFGQSGASYLEVLRAAKGVIDARAIGAVGDGVTDDYDAMLYCWTTALAQEKNIRLDGYFRVSGERNFPFTSTNTSSLYDCANLALLCTPQTRLWTDSIAGADVLQLNALSNFHVDGNPKLLATISSTPALQFAGSNGVSITGGWDNITLDVSCINLAYLEIWNFIISANTPVVGASYTNNSTTFLCLEYSGGTMRAVRTAGTNLPAASGTLAGTNNPTYSSYNSYADGGKAVTFQPPTSGTLKCGTARTRLYAKGCAMAFDYEPDLAFGATQPAAVYGEVIAEDCYRAIQYSSAASSGALTAGVDMGMVVRAQTINCQRDVVLGRMHGGQVDAQIVTTKTAAARLLNPSGGTWMLTDQIVDALYAAYAYSSVINVIGYKGGCNYKAQIGGATAGSSGLFGATQDSQIYLNIGGTATSSDLLEVNSGGNTMRYSRLSVTTLTTTTFPSDFTDATRFNEINCIGTYGKSLTPASVRFPSTKVSSTDANTLDYYKEYPLFGVPLVLDATTPVTNAASSILNITVTISVASPAIVTYAGDDLYANNDPITFQTTGALPTGLSTALTYYVKNLTAGANTFEVSATAGGASINTTGAGSGTHYLRPSPAVITYAGADIYTANDIVTFTTSGTLPAPLSTTTIYYVRNLDAAANTFEVSLSSGGSVSVNMTDAGSGTHTICHYKGQSNTNSYISATVNGDVLNWSMALTMTSLGTLTTTDQLKIKFLNLPNPSSGTVDIDWPAVVGKASSISMAAAGDIPHGHVESGSPILDMWKWPAAGTTGSTAMAISELTLAGVLKASGWYKTAT